MAIPPQSPTTAPQTHVGALINRNFSWLFVGQLVSVVGDQVFDITLTLWVGAVLARGQPWAPLAVSGTLIAAVTPAFLIGPLAGVFVDRWNHRRTMLRMDIIRAALILALLVIAGFIPLPFYSGSALPIGAKLGIIYAIVFLASCCAQFFNPARFALLGAIVPTTHRPRASGLLQTTYALSVIVGPPLAAPLLFGFGVQWALLANAGSFLISFSAIALIRPPALAPHQKDHKTIRSAFVQGLTYAFGNATIRTIIIASAMSALGLSVLETLLLFFVTGNLHAAARVFGYFPAALGVGSLIGAMGMTVLGNRLNMTGMARWTVLLSGVVLLLFSRQSAIIPALLLLLSFGVLQAVLNVAISPLLLKATPPDLIGRVVAVINPSIQGGLLLGIVLSGYLASTVLVGWHTTVVGQSFGPIDTVICSGGLLVLASGIYVMVALREPVAPVAPANTTSS